MDVKLYDNATTCKEGIFLRLSMCVGELVTDDDDIDTDATSTQTAIKKLGNSPHHSTTLRLVIRGILGWHQTKGERENL